MKIKVYNLEGKEVQALDVSEAVFGIKPKSGVLHEVFVAQRGNAREPWADTKGRGDVSGGGKKPWPQKGTGRARHGSIRSPIWKGGGVTFGPKTERNYKTKINKQTRRLAVKMALSDKLGGGALWVVENFAFAEPKTKLFAGFLKKLPAKQHSFLVLTAGKDAAVQRMTNNVPKVETMRAEDVNVVALLNKQAVVTTVAGIKLLEAMLQKKTA